MKYRRYAEYKDSGVEWLGEVPAHWQVKKLSRLRCLAQTGPFGSQLHAEDYVDDGYPVVNPSNLLDGAIVADPQMTVSAEMREALSRHVLKTGDIVFGRRGELGRAALVTDREAGWLCGTGSILVRLEDTSLAAEYFSRYLRISSVKDYLVLESVGSTMDNLNTSILLALPIVVPPSDEQRAIVTFLDRETAQIDALIAKQERLIAVLQEKRHALISHAVTKGLNPDAPMKDSGVEWLGEVPAHWGAVRLKQKWFVIDCKHRTATYIDNGIPIVSTTEVKPGRIVLDGARQTTEQDYQDLAEGRRKPQRSDIIYSRNASVGSAAYVDTDERFCMGQDVCLITSDCENQLFLMYQLNSPIVMNQVDAFGVGATFSRINVQQIENFFVACPPLSEQIEIAEYIDRHDQMFVALMRHVTMIRILLLERRAALISAAVTGKIDVRSQVR